MGAGTCPPPDSIQQILSRAKARNGKSFRNFALLRSKKHTL